MKIISHRGYWEKEADKNTPAAFERSFELGFGTETDIRDCVGQLVISHDMPSGTEQSLNDFLRCATKFVENKDAFALALNIKADGMAIPLSKELLRFPGLDCFAFDMSIPDMRQYIKQGVPVFTRMSEIERSPSFLGASAGVWLDAFESEWYNDDLIKTLIEMGKRVCIVSPELHGRPYLDQWSQLRAWTDADKVLLCTDKPEQARAYFEGMGL